MRWIEVCVDTPGGEIDARCEELAALGAGGFVIENEDDFREFLENNRQYWDYVDRELEESYSGVSRIKTYLADDADGRAILAAIRERYPSLGVSYVEDSDWENNWREYYKPIEVGERLVVVPEWEETPQNGRIPLRLDPGLIFGTGSHPTTRMCLAALEGCAGPGKRVLDLGCGSGILSIASRLLGATEATAVDIDPIAESIAYENAEMNGIGRDNYHVLIGNVLSDTRLQKKIAGQYPVVAANIVADVIIALAPIARPLVAAGGVFLVSGIIDERVDEVKKALNDAGFSVEEHKRAEGWNAFLCR